MRSVKVITQTNYTWITSINGTDKEIKNYFLGKYFNIGQYPTEKIDKVVKVEML